jgi:hypothetical protein
MGTREDALEGICSYNQAGTLRTLRQYETMTGQLPNGMHTGLVDSDSAAASMKLPPAFQDNLKLGAYHYELTTEDANALKSIGITTLAYGPGNPKGTTNDDVLGYQTVEAGKNVIEVSNEWVSDDNPFTFNGRTINTLKSLNGYRHIIALFITPTADWSAKGSSGWVKGFNVGMDIPGTCPIPNDEGTEFAYYVAYVGLRGVGFTVTYTAEPSQSIPANMPEWSAVDTGLKDADGSDLDLPTDVTITGTDVMNNGTKVATLSYKPAVSDAALVGTSCPECGITNP